MTYYIPNPSAVAHIHGRDQAPGIYGEVQFYQDEDRVLISANIAGLPKDEVR